MDTDDLTSIGRILRRYEDRLPAVFALVVVLMVIYGLYLYRLIAMNHEDSVTSFGVFIARILLVSFIGGAPFAVMAWLDPRWRSRHAAEIAIASWVMVFGVFAVVYGAKCPLVAIFLFIPLTFGALVGHNIGTLRHPPTLEEFDEDRAA